MDLIYGVCVAATLIPNQGMPCGRQPMSFRDVYAVACHQSKDGRHWAGDSHEYATDVQRRVMDGAALYQDYLRTWHEVCDKEREKQK